MVREVDHCMMTSKLDDIHFPQKPTTWLLHNCAPQDDAVCFNRCANRLPHKDALCYHRVLVCPRANKHPEQIVLTDDLEKSRIPLGMFGHIQSLYETRMVKTAQVSELPTTKPVASQKPTPVPQQPPTKLKGAPTQPISQLLQTTVPILATGKKAQAEAINTRVQQLNGLTLQQALQIQLPSNKPPANARRHAATSAPRTPFLKKSYKDS